MKFLQQTITAGAGSAPFRAYIPDAAPRAHFQTNRPAVIVFPGGGYAQTYPGEAEPIALAYAARGFCAFVLDYSVYPARFPQALLEGLTAVRFVRDHAAEYGIDPHRISVCGFSAGGHLAASVGTLWDHECLEGRLEGDRALYKPDSMVLSYPVTNPSHFDSMLNLFSQNKEELTPEMLEFLSLENHVKSSTPPAFLWHNSDDAGVPVSCTLTFGLALHRAGVPFEMRIWEKGGHGTCLGSYITHETTEAMECAPWVDESAAFLLKH